MNLGRIKKKLREAEFFLSKMQDEERERFGPEEPFEFYLSAFLTASRSVVEVLKYMINKEPSENRPIYNDWHKRWNDKLGAADKCFLKSMVKKRDAEVHNKGAGHRIKIEQEEFPNMHREQSTGAYVLVGAPHGVSLGHYDINRYYITIDGREQPALEACAKYVEFWRRMITELETASP